MPQGRFITSKVRDQLALGADSGTVTVDLPTANYLQGVLLRIENTNGATSNTGATVESDIDKVEIVADGVVVFSMNGEMCRKFEQFDKGNFPPMDESQVGAAVQWAVFPIKFGRDDFDKDIILPAHRFSTLQAKVTWSFTDSATAGWATSETNAKLDVLARYLVSNERVNTPFLRKLDVYSKTVTSTGTEEVDLPVGAGNGAYRRIMLHAYEAAIEDAVDIDKYELLVNDAQRIVDERWATSQLEDEMRYKVRSTKNVKVVKSNADTYASKVSRINKVVGSLGAVCCGVYYNTATAGDTLTLGIIAQTGGLNLAVTGAQQAHLHIEGSGAAFATMIDLGTDNLSDSLDVSGASGVSSLKIRYNQAASGSANTVVVEQLVSY